MLVAFAFASSGCTFLDSLGDLTAGSPNGGTGAAGGAEVQGFGKSATGGASAPECMVTSSEGSGPGTLDDCLDLGSVSVKFAVAEVTLDEKAYVDSNTTIDGCAGGMNGVTLSLPSDQERGLVIEGPKSNVIVRCIRFQGEGKKAGASFEFDLLALDGQGGQVSNVLVDRCTFVRATDGALDIAFDVVNVTVQRSLFYGTPGTMLIKYGTRNRLSLHHNVYTGNGESNPQVTGAVGYLDFVSNVVHDCSLTSDGVGGVFTPYGMRIEHDAASDATGIVNANIIANAFLDGQSEAFEQVGTGNVFFAESNRCEGCVTGTVAPALIPLPSGYEEFGITPTPVTALVVELLPSVGSPNRTTEDQTRIDSVAQSF